MGEIPPGGTPTAAPEAGRIDYRGIVVPAAGGVWAITSLEGLP